MNYAEDLIYEPREKCKVCSHLFPKDDIHKGICLCCWDSLDKRAEDSFNRFIED